MNFSKAIIADHTKAHVPVCDDNYSPPLCSNLYHDQSQTPGYPHGDGNCLAPGCDVGSVPVGEYLFDPRAVSHHLPRAPPTAPCRPTVPPNRATQPHLFDPRAVSGNDAPCPTACPPPVRPPARGGST